MFCLFWYEAIIGLKWRILAIFHDFMFIKVRNYLAPNFTTEDFRIQVRGLPTNYIYGCHMTPVTRGTLGYAPHQKGIIQGHLVHRYAPRRAPALCSSIVFQTVLSLYVSTQTVFIYYMSVKHILRGYFLCFLYPFYALVVMSNRWNQYNFSTLHLLFTCGHRCILAL